MVELTISKHGLKIYNHAVTQWNTPYSTTIIDLSIILKFGQSLISELDCVEMFQGEILLRHALHGVAQVVSYTDSLSKHNVAFKIGSVGRTVFDGFVFQCLSEVSLCFLNIHLLFLIIEQYSRLQKRFWFRIKLKTSATQ